MQVYHYNAAGFLIGEGEAFQNPLEGGYLVPANATLLAPPTPGAGQAAKFVSGAWELAEDPAIAVAEAEAEALKFIVVYRDKPGRDTKVLRGALKSTTPVAGTGEATQEFATEPSGWNTVNARGIAMKMIDGGLVADRLVADIGADVANRAGIYADAEVAIGALLADKDPTTHLMENTYAMYIATNIPGTYTQGEIDGAKAVLATAKDLADLVQVIRSDRDAEIAALQAD